MMSLDNLALIMIELIMLDSLYSLALLLCCSKSIRLNLPVYKSLLDFVFKYLIFSKYFAFVAYSKINFD